MNREKENKLVLAPMIKSVTYGYSDNHRLLIKNHNIGKNGEDLTIMVLSLNRAELTIKLLDSIQKHIPGFMGHLLIIDNGSDEEEKEKIKEHMKKLKYSCKFLELGQNYGVSGGRNRGIEHVKTPWVMSLDNDIYFIGNPINSINEVTSKTGSHFINIPLLNKSTNRIFTNGGHLYIGEEEGEIHISTGSMYTQDCCIPSEPYDFSLSTFLYGGASLFLKETFINVGGFDENMFIGFEDADFSIRLFRQGLKVANCGIACLVHDHPKPKSHNDADYETMRHSREILKKSAEYFEEKHDIIVWTAGVDDWLEENKHKTSITKFRNEKPNIALVIDSRGWAFDNIADQIIKHLGEKYKFTKIYADDFKQYSDITFTLQEYELVHFFWRPLIDMMKNEESRLHIEENLSGDFSIYINDFYNSLNISTCVYDHLLRNNPSNQALNQNSLNRASHYYVSSEKLMDLYNQDITVNEPDAIIQDGVDTFMFKNKNQERFSSVKNRTIRIGWVDIRDVEWAEKDLKGISTIIKPSISALKLAGYDVELDILDRNVNPIKHEKMPEYYNSIDIYICASLYEGTPNPILEAMSCGVPVITTDVGIVTEVFGEKQKQFIIKERTPEAFAQAIKRLIDNPDYFTELSKENIESIKPWDWKNTMWKFQEYFDYCLGL